MRKLSFIILPALALTLLSVAMTDPSPHGKDFRISCGACHSANGWKLDKSVYSYDHNASAFPLTGQHVQLSCRSCHPTLVFADAKTACVDCHTDMHDQTVGPDCGRCHTTRSWVVENITRIHQMSRFPLVGPHFSAECVRCHPSASLLRFDPTGTECYVCHKEDYNSASRPNHLQGNYPTNCIQCHSPNSYTWNSSNVDHSFFPLTLGHDLNDCNTCHPGGNFTGISNECVSCHLANYNTTTNPNHASLNFGTNCVLCHTTNPGWHPASFNHDNFPLTSGHAIEDCNKCHNGNYTNTPNECVSCHLANYNATTNPNHTTLNFGTNCVLCHTTNPGWRPASFNHDNFPLTSGHAIDDCNKCHNGNYTNTPNECVSCHLENYNGSTNPNHASLTIPTTCNDCHTTTPGWKPATFPIHSNYYVIAGAHLAIAGDCAKCHNGNYTSTPNTCVGCHLTEYNQTTNPPHASAQFPVNCESCHTQNAWVPSTFDHDGQYFPIYSGKHAGEWNLCADCHTNPSNYAVFSCIDCHEHNQPDMNDKHSGVTGYSYNSQACYQCHPTGNEGGKRMHPSNSNKKN